MNFKIDLSKNRKIEVMGILNITPDSFSDGGKYLKHEHAFNHAKQMLEAGATWIDIGGESTRPNAKEVSEQEELDRVIPIIELVSKAFNCQISVDTSKPKVMEEAWKAGAKMLNDVRSFRLEGALDIAVKTKLPICLMHMVGTPQTMQNLTKNYNHPIEIEVSDFFNQQIARCIKAGIDRDNILIDPGFGFGKSLQDNYRLLHHLDRFKSFELPILIGLSRKSMIGNILNLPPKDCLFGSLSGAVIGAMNGASIVRVHDVKATVEAIKILEATINE